MKSITNSPGCFNMDNKISKIIQMAKLELRLEGLGEWVKDKEERSLNKKSITKAVYDRYSNASQYAFRLETKLDESLGLNPDELKYYGVEVKTSKDYEDLLKKSLSETHQTYTDLSKKFRDFTNSLDHFVLGLSKKYNLSQKETEEVLLGLYKDRFANDFKDIHKSLGDFTDKYVAEIKGTFKEEDIVEGLQSYLKKKFQPKNEEELKKLMQDYVVDVIKDIKGD